jgi:hypothetical protein
VRIDIQEVGVGLDGRMESSEQALRMTVHLLIVLIFKWTVKAGCIDERHYVRGNAFDTKAAKTTFEL